MVGTMSFKDYKVVNEQPIITDHVEVKVLNKFFSQSSSNPGKNYPSMVVTNVVPVDGKILLMRVVVNAIGKNEKDETLYSIQYGVRVALQFNQEIGKKEIEDQEFINFYAEKVYQRVADRINHIGFDMGVAVMMPMFRDGMTTKLTTPKP